MSTWLRAWRNRDTRESIAPIMELMVLAGDDAGHQYTLEGDRVLVGRGQPESGQTHLIRLSDTSISRRQAWICRESTGTSIEHIESATNATLVNGVEINKIELSVGDRIEMGCVVIAVHARGGVNLRGLTEIMEHAATANESTNTTRINTSPAVLGVDEIAKPPRTGFREPGRVVAEEVTEARQIQVHIGELSIVRGVETTANARFPISSGRTRIGRGEDVEIRVPELGVSRLHAEIAVDGRSIVLTPKSRTNATLVNGLPVHGKVELGDGDEIQLADRVVLGFRLSSAARKSLDRSADSASGLSRRMEHKIDLDREIAEFNVMGSFVDVDVVASRAMKGGSEKAEHIIVSFERFRSYVGGICQEYDGQVLNSNGDELMCFFETAASAVLAGSTILERLADFNRDLNLLSRDFRFRLGVHTGVSLVDLDAGIAYSQVLDTAGHIQKIAEPDTLVVSQTTLESLPETISATPIAELQGEAGQLYRIDCALRRSDFDIS